MRTNVRIRSTENIVTNAKVELRDGGSWVDISEYVNSIAWTPSVGDASWITLRLVPAAVDVEGITDDATLECFAAHLRARGWQTKRPAREAMSEEAA